MDMLLKEMQEMEKFAQKPVAAPSVINEVTKLQNPDQLWSAPPKNDESLAEVKYLKVFSQPNLTQLIISVLETIAGST
jgi:hypothetical protein